MPDEKDTTLFVDLGEVSVDQADDANIPVNIWITRESDEDENYIKDGKWELRAENYMPRKGRISGESSYKVVAADRQVLVDLVHKHWLPLYQTAVRVLTELKQDKEGIAGLYYWTDRM